MSHEPCLRFHRDDHAGADDIGRYGAMPEFARKAYGRINHAGLRARVIRPRLNELSYLGPTLIRTGKCL